MFYLIILFLLYHITLRVCQIKNTHNLLKRSSSKKVTKNDGIDIKRREDEVKNQEASDQMSESYHEIFDTLMPPETAKARLLAESASETEHEDINEALSSCNLDKSSSPTRYS